MRGTALYPQALVTRLDGTMSLIGRTRGLIAASHGNLVTGAMASAARKYLNAYNNVVNWDMQTNGELRALRLLAARLTGDIFDVGANAGQWATAMLSSLGDKWLHCFEPVPAVFAKLQSTLADVPNVQLNNAGLGSQSSELEFNYSPGVNTITSRYELIYDRPDRQKITCPVLTGDAYLASQGVNTISVLKIDVEGMEMDVLAGFEGALSSGRIMSVQFEHGESHILSGHMLKNFVDLFEGHGLKVYSVLPRALVPLNYTFASEGFEGRNFFAIQESIIPELGLA